MVKTVDEAAGKVIMEVRYKTNGPYKGQVEYGIDTNYGSTSQVESDFITEHVVTLSDLKMSTSYHYRIVLKTKDNKDWKSGDYTGKTPNPAQ